MFITFEGIEGAGKSTLIHMLDNFLKSKGKNVKVTCEPGATEMGRKLRQILLDKKTGKISPVSEFYLFLADRVQHINEVILPAINNKYIVLCDRYTDSTLAYQGYGRGLDLNSLQKAGELCNAPVPDYTILLDLPVNTGLMRVAKRNAEKKTNLSEDRFDSENIKFHTEVRKGFLDIAKKNPQRIKIINAEAPPDNVFIECLKILPF